MAEWGEEGWWLSRDPTTECGGGHIGEEELNSILTTTVAPSKMILGNRVQIGRRPRCEFISVARYASAGGFVLQVECIPCFGEQMGLYIVYHVWISYSLRGIQTPIFRLV